MAEVIGEPGAARAAQRHAVLREPAQDYESLPKLDQSYADTGVPGHFVEPQATTGSVRAA